jgi:septin family protein
LVGRSQTGKSTIVETFLQPQGIGCIGFSHTRDPACNSLVLTDKHNKKSYQLNIIETPGLKDLSENEESRSDDELLKNSLQNAWNSILLL